MIWNLLLHVIAGFIGNEIFTISSSGLIWCFAISMATQAIDTIRIYYDTKKLIEQKQDAHDREEQMATFKKGVFIKFPQLYIMKTIFYSIVMLASAYLARAFL